ncbi:LTR retrotransposon, partial [Pseudoloma neurophilia]
LSNQREMTSLQNKKPVVETEVQQVAMGTANLESFRFTHGMGNKNAEVQMFMAEEVFATTNLTDKQKMAAVIAKSDQRLQTCYYERGSQQSLPCEWSQFKELFLQQAADSGLDKVEKYRDETWANYLKRLKMEAQRRKLDDNEVLKMLKGRDAPSKYQVLFLAGKLNLDELISTIETFEFMQKLKPRSNNKKKEQVKPKRRQITQENVTCYKCQGKGHFARNCLKKTKKSCLLVKSSNEDELKLSGKVHRAILDTGSDVNILTYKVASKLGAYEVITNESKEITLLNGNKMKALSKVKIWVEKDRFSDFVEFYVVDRAICDVILGKDLVNKVRGKSYCFPLVCTIPTPPGKIVSWGRPYNSEKDKEDFKKLLSEFERKGIVEESSSLWLNPVTLARKKDGSLRFCLDLRRLNSLVELDEFVIPNIQDMVRSLSDHEYFSVLDLKDGYFQVDLAVKDRQKTAFIDPDGRLMHFTKMPQGFKNSPAIFQRGMQMALKNLLNRKCMSYLDDILVFGKSESEHDENLRIVLERIGQFGLVVNDEKSKIKLREVDFLGYRITKNKVSPTEKRSQGIIDYEVPKSKKDLRGFLGTINYDRILIKNLADKAKILYEAINEEDRRLNWNPERQRVFEGLKANWEKS